MSTNEIRRDGMNELAAKYPEVGDMWVEMLSPTCLVIRVTEDFVVVINGANKEEKYTKKDFYNWLHYGTIPGTWTDYVGKRFDSVKRWEKQNAE